MVHIFTLKGYLPKMLLLWIVVLDHSVLSSTRSKHSWRMKIVSRLLSVHKFRRRSLSSPGSFYSLLFCSAPLEWGRTSKLQVWRISPVLLHIQLLWRSGLSSSPIRSCNSGESLKRWSKILLTKFHFENERSGNPERQRNWGGRQKTFLQGRDDCNIKSIKNTTDHVKPSAMWNGGGGVKPAMLWYACPDFRL